MHRQLFLFNPKAVEKNASKSQIRILTWNISNPSIGRARRQFEWLLKTEANVIILTEAKYSDGCLFLKNGLENVGFNVFFPEPSSNSYSVLIAEKGFSGERQPLDVTFLPERIAAVRLRSFLKDLVVVGMYVPSRGPAERRNVDKRRFQDQVIDLLASLGNNDFKKRMVAGGDLNVIPPDHEPRYSFFGDWEYRFYNAFLKFGMIDAYKYLNKHGQEHSWVGRSGDGYRFDHLFVSIDLSPHLSECRFIHEPRVEHLSDHSALYLLLKKPTTD